MKVGLLSPVPELAQSGDVDLSLLTVDDYPFTSTTNTSPIIALPHVVGTDLVLEHSNGSFFRTAVPPLCTTTLGIKPFFKVELYKKNLFPSITSDMVNLLVDTCMKALDYILPSDTYLQLTIKWYAMRHSPGAIAR